MQAPTEQRTRNQAGQALVVMVGALVAVTAMVGLVVDGGNAWVQQRAVQAASDSAAEAGAVILAQRVAGVAQPAGGWDAAVAAAVQSNASASGVSISAAYYTDICGIPLKPDGTAALVGGIENLAVATKIGSGSLPASWSTTPDCPSLVVGPPAGVMVQAHRNVSTYVAGVVGVTSLNVSTRATAVAGYLQGICDASAGQACAVLPVAFPVNMVACDGSNNPVNIGTAWPLNQIVRVPLCQNGPGNVGWLDWTPTDGGTSELITSIQSSDNPAINLPSWQFVTSTGNVNSQGVETAIRSWDGQVVLIPQFDLTCGVTNGITPDSTLPAINTGPNFGCPPGDLGGNGQNNYYRIPSFANFQLCGPSVAGCGTMAGAYVNGTDGAGICDTGGNGATSCLVGRFVSVLKTGTVGPGVGGGTGSTKTVGVQLIK